MRRTLFVTMAMFALMQPARADEVEDSYTKLQDAVAKKDADGVKAMSARVFKLADDLVNAPQPPEPGKADEWKQRVQYGKEVISYAEYALSSTSMQALPPAKTVDLVEMLLARNPKSKYLDIGCTGAYLAALGKSGPARQLEGMAKMADAQPDNAVALGALTEGLMTKNPDRALVYANQLASVLKTKPKPEGFPEAEWDKAKATWLGTAYFTSGVIYGSKSSWPECDRDLRAALPLNHDENRLGIVYFYLGLANYNLGKAAADKPRIQTALKYSQQSAAIPGPMKEQASHNVNAIQNELQRRK